jgi:hypothetical protein
MLCARCSLVLLLTVSVACRGGDDKLRERSDSPATARDIIPPVDTADPAATGDGSVGSAAAAVAVVRDYYDAIRERDFERAYGLWGDAERMPGQTLDEFRSGFAETASVEVTPGEPGRVEGAAGSRYIDVPVEIEATQKDGTVQRFRGTYALRRAVVPGATEEQRRWRLYAANIARVD